MAKVEQYQQMIQQLLTRYADIKPAYGEIERQTIFDVDRHHYQLVNTGWENHSCV